MLAIIVATQIVLVIYCMFVCVYKCLVNGRSSFLLKTKQIFLFTKITLINTRTLYKTLQIFKYFFKTNYCLHHNHTQSKRNVIIIKLIQNNSNGCIHVIRWTTKTIIQENKFIIIFHYSVCHSILYTWIRICVTQRLFKIIVANFRNVLACLF